MTKYAKDEFDQVPQNTSRQGVHRDAQETARPTLWPVLTVGAVALVLGLVAFLVLPNLGVVAPTAAPSVSTAGASAKRCDAFCCSERIQQCAVCFQ